MKNLFKEIMWVIYLISGLLSFVIAAGVCLYAVIGILAAFPIIIMIALGVFLMLQIQGVF